MARARSSDTGMTAAARGKVFRTWPAAVFDRVRFGKAVACSVTTNGRPVTRARSDAAMLDDQMLAWIRSGRNPSLRMRLAAASVLSRKMPYETACETRDRWGASTRRQYRW